MANSRWLLGLAGLASFALAVVAEEPQAFSHPGYVYEFDRRAHPIPDVSVVAWPEAQAKSALDNSGCPVYGDTPLAATHSDQQGMVNLEVAKERKTFTAVYCNQRYIPRAETLQSNRIDKSPLEPIPITLIPRAGSASSNRQLLAERYQAFLMQAEWFCRDVRYIEQHPSAFGEKDQLNSFKLASYVWQEQQSEQMASRLNAIAERLAIQQFCQQFERADK